MFAMVRLPSSCAPASVVNSAAMEGQITGSLDRQGLMIGSPDPEEPNFAQQLLPAR
jgi:hypothetical protein